MASRNRITVLGAGAGGCTLAFHLTRAGYEVLLYQDADHLSSLEHFIQTREIKAVERFDRYKGVLHGSAQIAHFTTNIRHAVLFSDVLIMVVPAYAQLTIFKAALPYLSREQIMLSLPGNFAIFDYLKCIRESKVKIESPLTHLLDTPVPCIFAESSIIPYACRKIKDNKIFVGAIKQFIYAGVFPPKEVDETLERLNEIFQVGLNVRIEQTHILATPFYNSNLILHPTIVMYNAGHIKCQNKGFRFYKDGVSPLVCKIFEALDKEFLQIGRTVGFNLESFTSYYRRYYGDKNINNNTLNAFFQGANFLHFVKAPNDLNGRFISEDLQYVLLPIIKYLAIRNNIPTPVADSLIVSIQCMLGNKINPLRDIPYNEWEVIASL